MRSVLPPCADDANVSGGCAQRSDSRTCRPWPPAGAASSARTTDDTSMYVCMSYETTNPG